MNVLACLRALVGVQGLDTPADRLTDPFPFPHQYMEEYMASPEVQQSLKMAEQLANDPEALGKFQQQLAEALGACVRAWGLLPWF